MKTVKLVAGVALVIMVVGVAPAMAQNGMTWAGSIYAGFAKDTETGAPSGSIGFRGNMFAMVHPVLGIGPEVGYHFLGKVSDTFADSDPSNPGGTINEDT